jgi:hypothetical protein
MTETLGRGLPTVGLTRHDGRSDAGGGVAGDFAAQWQHNRRSAKGA